MFFIIFIKANTLNRENTANRENRMKQRNIMHVLSRMIQIAPDEVCEMNFRNDLERQLEIARYTPPENMYIIWQSVQNIISDRFESHGDSSTLPQWGLDLLQIWTDKMDINK
jgi:hypothetical protein